MINLPHRARWTNRTEPLPRIHRRRFRRTARIGALLFASTILCATARDARAASSEQARTSSDVQVFASADESSLVIESVGDGGSLSPIAEMTGAGGLKWFMVKTKSGNVGWIKSGDTILGTKIDDHFRSLPKDPTFIESVSSLPDATSTTGVTGAVTIPIKIVGTKVLVPVSFRNGNSSATGYLALDTGAAQTMVSRRIASDLRLLSIDSQRRIGIGGSIVADIGLVDAVTVGKAQVRNMRVSIHNTVLNLGYEGLLGFDFLGRFQMSVDSEKQVLVLTPRKN
jgi:predicted aspartyl protease